ncbi:MAG: ABC transporter ATP-binding protein [Saprospiraceae bacterium]
MSNTAIRIENLSKQYRLGTIGTGTLHDDLNRWWHRIRGKEDPYLKIGETNDRAHRGSSEYVWALRDINLEVKQGEVLGIIGKNGAGKSTLLKILSKVTGPTTGRIMAKGRIASLLEVGTGFHPELTGRENIYLNGAILGMTKAEVSRKLDEIVDFAGVERYIDTPTKRYSSGMTVRLGFAVAAFLEEEILIVDEVLAVGDAEFQKKAIGKMQEVSSGGGRTVLFVSHNMASVAHLCSRGVLLENGRMTFDGEVNTAVNRYLAGDPNISKKEKLSKVSRKGNGKTKLTDINVFSDPENRNLKPVAGKDLFINLHYSQLGGFSKADIRIDLRIENHLGLRVGWLSTTLLNDIQIKGDQITFKIPSCPFNSGLYAITTCAYIRNDVSDWIQNVYSFEITEGDFYHTGKLPPKEQSDFLIKFELV